MQLLQVSFSKFADKLSYPFSLPLLAYTKSIDFTTPVTILVGENGCGKSMILMALPEATIFQIKDGKMQQAEYDDVEHVSLTRDFLSNPNLFVKNL